MVVAATHLELDQQVALKFMLPAAVESPEASARFMREARAAGRLTSEHVCRVVDVGRFDSGAPYIVMEYLEGYDLGTMLKRRGPLRVAPAVDYVLQACEGLAEAHAQGIIHRDLKPDNLYLSSRSDGGHIIKVLDFGISKATVTGIATQTGDILGSPAYMAPEQMKSTKDVDPRADVWSLGVVMYQLLTGRLPFSGDSLPTLCMSVLNDDPVPPEEIREDLPAGLSEVILRCMAKEAEDRYADVGELAAALGPFATPTGFGSVTRVRSALKGRQAPPDPSQTIPHGFSAQGEELGAVPAAPALPTLIGTDGALGPGSDLFVPRVASPPPPPVPVQEQVAGVTTVGASSGESIDMAAVRRRRYPVGLIGGLCGAIGFVVVLIVMVLRSGGDGGDVEPTTPPRTATKPSEEPVKPSAPQVTPIEDPATAPKPGTEPTGTEPVAVEPSGTEPTGIEPVDAKAAGGAQGTKTGGGTRPKWVRGNKTPPKGKDPKAAKDPSKEPDRSGSGAKPPDDPAKPDGEDNEDKWGRMQHDRDSSSPKEKAP